MLRSFHQALPSILRQAKSNGRPSNDPNYLQRVPPPLYQNEYRVCSRNAILRQVTTVQVVFSLQCNERSLLYQRANAPRQQPITSCNVHVLLLQRKVRGVANTFPSLSDEHLQEHSGCNGHLFGHCLRELYHFHTSSCPRRNVHPSNDSVTEDTLLSRRHLCRTYRSLHLTSTRLRAVSNFFRCLTNELCRTKSCRQRFAECSFVNLLYVSLRIYRPRHVCDRRSYDPTYPWVRTQQLRQTMRCRSGTHFPSSLDLILSNERPTIYKLLLRILRLYNDFQEQLPSTNVRYPCRCGRLTLLLSRSYGNGMRRRRQQTSYDVPR